MTKERAVVVCPGRGTYGREELGYLGRHHADKTDFLTGVDAFRKSHGRAAVTALDGARTYSLAAHASSENASALIYACALADVADIDRDRYEIVAVLGNSLGWYLALAAAGALGPGAAIRLVDTMGALMEEHGVGGQILYPLLDQGWQPSRLRQSTVQTAIANAQNETGETVYTSIRLGGYVVLAGSNRVLDALEAELPLTDGRFPLRLARHAAFHTSLLAPVADLAQAMLGPDLFRTPHIPLIDGRGAIWRSVVPDLDGLWAYTLGTQITQTYDFTRSVEVALREFAPDRLILTGPGSALGAPVAQTLVGMAWRGLGTREALAAAQESDPLILSMGIADQRRRVTG